MTGSWWVMRVELLSNEREKGKAWNFLYAVAL